MEEVETDVSVSLRAVCGRPRFRVGRFGVEDSEPEIGDKGEGEVRLSMCGEREGEMVWKGGSPQREGACEALSIVGEKQSGLFDWFCGALKGKLLG